MVTDANYCTFGQNWLRCKAARYRAAIVNKTLSLFILFWAKCWIVYYACTLKMVHDIRSIASHSGSRSSPISSSANSSSILCLPPTLVLGLTSIYLLRAILFPVWVITCLAAGPGGQCSWCPAPLSGADTPPPPRLKQSNMGLTNN